jgi:flagellar basal body-associated protein FliL
LYGEEKEQVLLQVLENLNGLMQFAQSQKFEDITHSYYMGVNEADMRLLDVLNPYTGIQIEALNPNQGNRFAFTSEMHFVSLNILFRCNIDLIAARRQLKKYVKSKGPSKLWILLLVLYTVVLAMPAGYLFYRVREVNAEIDRINWYLRSPYVTQIQADLAELTRETGVFKNYVRQAEEKKEWENSMPRVTRNILNTIILRHGERVTVTNFNFNQRTGVARVSAFCNSATVSSDYVDALYESGVALRVSYQGYGTDAAGHFTFTVDILLNPEVEE